MEKKRCGSLDFLKILGTLAIIFMHYQQMTGASFATGINYYNGSFNWGNAVELFFVISGFVMFPATVKIASGEEPDFGKFMLRRLRRFAPMMFVTAVCYEIISYILVYRYGDYSDWICISIWGIVQKTLCLDSGWGMMPLALNSPTWYICVLMFCYVPMYFATKICAKYGKSPIPVYIASVILGTALNTRPVDLAFLTSEMGRGYSAFFTGIIMGELFDKFEMHGRVQICFSLVIFLLTAGGVIFDTAAITYLLCPALLIVFTTKPAMKIFSADIWSTLGKIQFHVFVWHAVILLGIRLLGWMGLNADYSNRLLMYAFALFAELWGAFSYFVIEKRANRLFDVLLPKRKSEQ